MVVRDDVIKRLGQLGYTTSDADYEQVDFELDKVTNYVLNYCNITKIPDVLDQRIIDKVCGDFLYYKKNSGSLSGFNYEAVIKSIKEGDTTITYAVGQGEDTPENRFDSFVKSLDRVFDKWLSPWRAIRW